MAIAGVIAAVALVLFLGSLIELWTPLSSFLSTSACRLGRYALRKLEEIPGMFLEHLKAQSEGNYLQQVAAGNTTSVRNTNDEPASVTTPRPIAEDPSTVCQSELSEELPTNMPFLDDQSDSTTIHGEDDRDCATDSAASGLREEHPPKDEELWFDDGNLILTTSTMQFRVYRGLLTAQSLVFRDMLSLPQPPDSETSSKCTYCASVVTIPVADSPWDLRHFLKFMTGNGLFADGMHPTYHEISSLIRMAHKYQCETLLERCMKYMTSFYHDDFTLWRNDEAVFSPPRFDRIHCIGVVNLARLLGADKWLPGALMACCMLGAELFDGFVREDGTRETLSLDDLGRCYLGRANLVEANATATLKLLKQTLSPDCVRPDRCEPTLRKLLADLANVDEHKKTIFNLRWDWSWTPYVDRQDVERDLCWECYRMLGKQGRQKEIHNDIYTRLPELMNVKVDRWGMPDAVETEAPQDDADGTAPAPTAPAVGMPVVPPPIIVQPPQVAHPPPAPIIIPPAMPFVIPPPIQPPQVVPAGPPQVAMGPPAVAQAQAPPPPQPPLPAAAGVIIIPPPAAPGP